MSKDPVNISSLFFEAAKNFPHHIAIIDGKEKVSYRDLSIDVLRTAQYFRVKGIKKGDRVLVFVPMSIDLYRIVLSLFHIGAVAVFLDEWVSMKRMEECCRIAECKGFIGITKAHLLRFFSSSLRKIPIVLKTKGVSGMRHDHQEKTLPGDTALITFTTGSTGVPKAAKRTHQFLHEQFSALLDKIKPSPHDVDISLLPVVLLINLGVGATSVIARFKAAKPGKFDAGALCMLAKKHKVNRITGSPFFIKRIAGYLHETGEGLPGIKQVFTGGAPVFPHDAELFAKAFSAADVQVVYGSTEAEPISSISAAELYRDKSALTRGLPVGKPYHKAEVRIIPVTDQEISVHSESELETCGPGEVGEIIVAGPHVLKEYYNNESALRRNKIFLPGKVFHRTGDSGFLDREGQLHLTGRCSAVFIQNGKTIYPFLFEAFLQGIPGIAMGTVLQVGNQLLVAVETENSADRHFIAKHLNCLPVKPDRVLFLKKIPRDPRHNSKIDYERLKSAIGI